MVDKLGFTHAHCSVSVTGAMHSVMCTTISVTRLVSEHLLNTSAWVKSEELLRAYK